MTREEVRRAHKIATMAPEAHEAAREVGLDDNRRHLSADQRAYIAAKYLKPAEEEKARGRQACGQGGTLLPENLPEASKGDARDLAAAQVGLSGKTVDAAL